MAGLSGSWWVYGGLNRLWFDRYSERQNVSGSKMGDPYGLRALTAKVLRDFLRGVDTRAMNRESVRILLVWSKRSRLDRL